MPAVEKISTHRKAPDRAAVVAAAQAMVPDIRARARDTEQNRRVPDETVAAFKAAGLNKILLPERYGGWEMGYETLVEISAPFATACASTAWVCGLYIAHNWLASLFPEAAQDDIWGEDPDAVISGSYAPSGTVSPAKGGVRLSGRFSFSSGVPGSHWNLCGAFLPLGKDGAKVPAFTIVPKGDYTIDWDSWNTVGLSGTGSYDVLLDDVFVPEHRVLSFPAAASGEAPGTLANKSPLYKMPFLTCVPYSLATPAVGAALGAVELFIEENRARDTRGAVVLGGSQVSDFQTVQKRVGEATAKVDAGLALAKRDLIEAQEEVARDGKTSMDIRMRNRRSQSFMVRQAKEAADLILEAAGGRCIQIEHPIQRAWRDVNAVAAHISMNYDAVMSMYGQFRLGKDLVGQY